MIASLPMYDRAETRAANDRLWQATRTALGFGPAALTRTDDPWTHWTNPTLLLSQTCGFPYRARLHGQVQLVGAPVLALDCEPGLYYSVLVARRDDPRQTPEEFATATLAYNDPLSQSGWAAPANMGLRFARHRRTGAHRASALAVAEGRADIAALDALSWMLIARHDPAAATLREIGRTPPTPALPYITGPGQDADRLFEALCHAIAALSAADRDTLGLRGLARIAAAAYLAVPTPAPPPETA